MKSQFPRFIEIIHDPLDIGKRQWPLDIISGTFLMGDIFATSKAWNRLIHADVMRALFRHALGDWDECDPEALEGNQAALTWGGRIETEFQDKNGSRFIIQTKRETQVTTILLPEES
ncbi:MAG TPA: hypothetical protein VFE46_02000 [Pirellulales bacterium]|jgi:hypothetical protein|nr:hypothetical protein [Pirellulales bacterium]